MSDWDVVVVGAGPAGAASAAELARRGYHVALLDRATFPRHKACAEFMSPGVQAVARRLGLWDAIQDAGPHVVPGMEVVSPRGTTLRLTYEVSGRRAHAMTLPRHELDMRLVQCAVNAGAVFVPGMTVHEAKVQQGAVRGVKGSRNGAPTELEARLTIVADGGRSKMARALQLAQPARWPRRMGLVAHFEGVAPLRDGFGQMHVDRDGYCGIAPLPNGCLNVALVVREDAVRRSGGSAADFFDRWVEAHPATAGLLAAARRASPVRGMAPIGARARQVSTDGSLLVGDAAGFFDPFTGEGIYRALRGAELAAQVAHDALLRDDVSAASLAGYGALRRTAFRRKYAVTALVQLFVQYPALMEYALPRLERRQATLRTLGAVLGDCLEAEAFLNLPTLWAALRP